MSNSCKCKEKPCSCMQFIKAIRGGSAGIRIVYSYISFFGDMSYIIVVQQKSHTSCSKLCLCERPMLFKICVAISDGQDSTVFKTAVTGLCRIFTTPLKMCKAKTHIVKVCTARAMVTHILSNVWLCNNTLFTALIISQTQLVTSTLRLHAAKIQYCSFLYVRML